MGQVRRGLPRIDAPLLVMQSAADTVVDPRSADIIYDEVSSTVKEKVIA